jgi:hypothetical protein
VVQEALSIEVAGCKNFFFARGKWCRRHFQLRWQGAKPFFRFEIFFLKFNLKIL